MELAFGLRAGSTGLIADSLLADADVYALSLLPAGRHRDGSVHMRPWLIFPTNNTLANLGEIAAGLLVLRGWRRILHEGRLSAS